MHTCTMKYMIYTYNAPPDVLLDPCVCGMAADPYADSSAFSPAHKPDQPPYPPPDGPHHSPHRPSYCGETGALLDMYPMQSHMYSMQCTYTQRVFLERSGTWNASSFLPRSSRTQKVVPLSLCIMYDSGPDPFPHSCAHHGTSMYMSLTKHCIARVNIIALIAPFRYAGDTHIPRPAFPSVSLAWYLYTNYQIVEGLSSFVFLRKLWYFYISDWPFTSAATRVVWLPYPPTLSPSLAPTRPPSRQPSPSPTFTPTSPPTLILPGCLPSASPRHSFSSAYMLRRELNLCRV